MEDFIVLVKVKYTIYTIAGALAFNNYSDAFRFGAVSNGPINALAIDCAGSETSLQSCPINTNTSFQCDSRSDVGVVCQGNSLVNQARISNNYTSHALLSQVICKSYTLVSSHIQIMRSCLKSYASHTHLSQVIHN